MNPVERVLNRRRPGSGSQGGISRTDAEGIDQVEPRVIHEPTSLRPGEPHPLDAAWPVAVSVLNHEQRPNRLLADVGEFAPDPDAEAIPYHEPDDESVLSKLFHIRI